MLTLRDDWPRAPGSYATGAEDSPVAIAVIGKAEVDVPPGSYRIMGSLRSANIGVEKVIINIVSDPRIRYLIVCGREDGHYPGDALLALSENGVDERMGIIGAKAQFACLPDLDHEMVDRFLDQVTVVDLLDPKESEGDIDWEDPLFVFEGWRNEELLRVAQECAEKGPAEYPAPPMHIDIPGLLEDRMDFGEALNDEINRMTDLMLRMPGDALSLDSLNITVSETFAVVMDPVEGLMLEVPTVTFHRRLKSYLTGNE